MRNLCFWVLLFCTGCSVSKKTQWPVAPDIYQNELDNKWPSHHNIKGLYDPSTGSKIDGYVISQGYLITNKNDTLKGYIKIPVVTDTYQPSAVIPFLPFNNQGAKDIQDVKINEINVVKIALPGSTDSVEYIPHNSALWILLGRKNNITLCYQNWQSGLDDPNDIYATIESTEMILLYNNGTSIKVFSKSLSSLRSDKASILKFINKRYAQHFSKKSFKDENAMVDYILNKENEIEKNGSTR